jgi:hypothetical protein
MGSDFGLSHGRARHAVRDSAGAGSMDTEHGVLERTASRFMDGEQMLGKDFDARLARLRALAEAEP